MAQLVVATAGAIVGNAILPGIGGQIGWAIGATLGGALAPGQHYEGARLTDLKAPKLQYGAKWPRIYGRVRTAGIVLWQSDLEEVATDTEQGGKGGPTATTTTFTYYRSVLFGFSEWDENATIKPVGISRIWRNGKLIWSHLTDSSAATVTASDSGENFDAVDFFDGNPSQLPWTVYEAAIGADNAIGWRYRATCGITRINCGTSDQTGLFEFEVVTNAGTGTALTRLESYFTGDDSTDISAYLNGSGSITGATLSGGALSVDMDNAAHPSTPSVLTYQNANIVGDGSAVTVEFFTTWSETPNISYTPVFEYVPNTGTGDYHRIGWYGAAGLMVYDNAGFGIEWTSGAPVTGRTHVALVFSATGFRLYVSGTKVYETFVDSRPSGGTLGQVRIGDFQGYTSGRTRFTVDEFAVRFYEQYTADFTPPTHIDPPDGNTIDPGTEDLADILAQEHLRANGGDASEFDVEALRGIPVIGFVAQGSGREGIEALRTAYYFDAYCTDKVYYVLRGGDSVSTIPWADSGVSQDGNGTPFVGPARDNDQEVAQKVSVTYTNLDADYDNGTETGDRLIGVANKVDQIQLPIVFQPPRAKGIAETAAADARYASQTAKLQLDDAYAALTPTDVITPTDPDGNTYRMRVVEQTYSQGIYDLQLVLDDASVLTTVGITSNTYSPTISVEVLGDTEVLLLDVPIMQDTDDDAGFYAVMKPTTGTLWRGGAAFYESLDAATYTQDASVINAGVFGTTTTALGDWTGGVVFDETNTVTVNVGDGTLSSSTRDAILDDPSINAFVIGDEVINAVNCTLVSTGVYTLSRLLRGRRGTEWAMTGHLTGEDVWKVGTSGALRIARTTPQINVPYSYKGVTVGRNLDTADAETFTDTAVGLKPFAPVDLRGSRATNGDAVLTWVRRTRLATSFTGTGGSVVPLGEASESYEIDICDSGFNVVRTLTSTSPTVNYTLANQETDFGSAQSLVYAKVYQMSATVGRGYPLTSVAVIGDGLYFTPLTSNSYPDVRLADGTQFLATRNGSTAMGLYHYTEGDTELELVAKVSADNGYRYLQGAHLWATDGSGNWVMYLRGYTNRAADRKLMHGNLTSKTALVVTPAFMTSDPPFALGYAGSTFIALCISGTVYHSADLGVTWSSAGSVSGITPPAAANYFNSGRMEVVGSTLAMSYGGGLFYNSGLDGLSWSSATGDVASDPSTYTSAFVVRCVASTGSVGCAIASGRIGSSYSTLIYTSTDGQAWTRRVASAGALGTSPEDATFQTGVSEWAGNFYVQAPITAADGGRIQRATLGTWSGATVYFNAQAALAIGGTARMLTWQAGTGDPIVATSDGDVFNETIAWP